MKFTKYICRKALALVLVAAAALSVFLTHGQKGGSYGYAPTSLEVVECGVIDAREYKLSSRFLELFATKSAESETVLIPGGMVFGARVKQAEVTVEKCDGASSVKPGDKLLEIDGISIKSAKEVKDYMAKSDGSPISLTLMRGESKLSVKITPKPDSGEYKLGLELKDGAAGIGTITYINPKTGEFGGLGHGICDAESGEVIEITSGTATGVILGGTKRGEAGKPGELSGILTDKCIGTVISNTPCGVFGVLSSVPKDAEAISVELGHREDVHVGQAYIISTVKNGKSRKFDIEITEVDTSSHGTKSFKIKVTDPSLIAITGGIVRGMSGSPIIQDGKLVGAVTHVLVADPTEGYGIFIENMLNASESAAGQRAA